MKFDSRDFTTFSTKKVISPEQIGCQVNELKAKGKSIATLNGSFDLFHAGHLHILFEASKVADVLIVGLNTDRSIQEYKSPKRPIISLPYRIQMITALAFVDYVTWFDETDPRALLTKIKPDVHVNGEEYGMECIESSTVKACGGRIHLVSRIPGLATSQILEKIQNSCA